MFFGPCGFTCNDEQVRYWARVHLVAERCQMASWVAYWWLSRPSGIEIL